MERPFRLAGKPQNEREQPGQMITRNFSLGTLGIFARFMLFSALYRNILECFQYLKRETTFSQKLEKKCAKMCARNFSRTKKALISGLF